MEESANRLTKKERLSDQTIISSLITKGESLFVHPFKVFYVKNDLEYNRIVFSVPKRLFKRAVKRNLIRRRSKEAYRLNKGGFSVGYDLFFVYISKTIENYHTIDGKIKEILDNIKKMD